MQLLENDIILKGDFSPYPISQDRNFVFPDGYLWTQGPSSYLKYIFSGNFKSFRDRMYSSATFQYIPQFALYPRVDKTRENDAKIINLIEVIRMMRGSEQRDKAKMIMDAQEIGDEARRAELKKSLPYITHSGIFIPRCNAGLRLPGFTYQLDIDKIPNPKELLEKIIVDKELEILFATVSASGNGIKAMLFLKDLMSLRDGWNVEQYKRAYDKVTDILSAYFRSKYNISIDTQMKSISQPFFLFYSPDLHVHKNLKGWV
jgi:hypothetical protein